MATSSPTTHRYYIMKIFKAVSAQFLPFSWSQVSAKELQNLGMPSAGSRANHGDYNTRGTNGYSAPPNPNPSSLPPAMRGMNPTQFNPVIRLGCDNQCLCLFFEVAPLKDNIIEKLCSGYKMYLSLPFPVTSCLTALPPALRGSQQGLEDNSFLWPNFFWRHFLFFRTSSSSVTKIPDTGGYLDPETGDWVSTNSRGDVTNSEEENSRHSHSSSRASKNTQVGSDFSVNSGDGTFLF